MSDEESDSYDRENAEETENDEEEEEDKNMEEDDDEKEHTEEEQEEIFENPLSEELISQCISLLCKTGDGLSHAFVKLNCIEREITDISILARYIYLRYLDLSKNLIKDISSLNSLTQLLVMKCEHNQLTSPQLDSLPYLQYLNLNNNKIKSLGGISHQLLEHLCLNYNEIHSAGGAFGYSLDPTILTRLHTLELRGNKFESTEGFYLPNLKHLFLAENSITRLPGLNRLTTLTTLHLRDNKLEFLDGFSENMQCLQYVNLRENLVNDMKEIKKLQCLPTLRAIVLYKNPIADDDEYRFEVLVALRRIIRLDKDDYTNEEREEAEAVYEQRRQEEVANKILMDEQAAREILEQQQTAKPQETPEQEGADTMEEAKEDVPMGSMEAKEE